ncbi:MAG: hypothetical protein ACLQU2_33730 [Candidatus Binataceae bacterium]
MDDIGRGFFKVVVAGGQRNTQLSSEFHSLVPEAKDRAFIAAAFEAGLYLEIIDLEVVDANSFLRRFEFYTAPPGPQRDELGTKSLAHRTHSLSEAIAFWKGYVTGLRHEQEHWRACCQAFPPCGIPVIN